FHGLLSRVPASMFLFVLSPAAGTSPFCGDSRFEGMDNRVDGVDYDALTVRCADRSVHREGRRTRVGSRVAAVEADLHRASRSDRAVPGHVGRRHGRAALRLTPERAPAFPEPLAGREVELERPSVD